MIVPTSQIFITKDYDSFKNELIVDFGKNNVRFFENENFLIEDAKNAIYEACIAENNLKLIVLYGLSFGIEAQNCLLKILEETPDNIIFILVSNSKNTFLPTISSRLPVYSNIAKENMVSTGIDYKNLNLKNINLILEKYETMEKKGEFGKHELKNLIYAIFFECLQDGVNFNQDDIYNIHKMMILADLNTKTSSVLIPLLMIIGDRYGNI